MGLPTIIKGNILRLNCVIMIKEVFSPLLVIIKGNVLRVSLG